MCRYDQRFLAKEWENIENSNKSLFSKEARKTREFPDA